MKRLKSPAQKEIDAINRKLANLYQTFGYESKVYQTQKNKIESIFKQNAKTDSLTGKTHIVNTAKSRMTLNNINVLRGKMGTPDLKTSIPTPTQKLDALREVHHKRELQKQKRWEKKGKSYSPHYFTNQELISEYNERDEILRYMESHKDIYYMTDSYKAGKNWSEYSTRYLRTLRNRLESAVYTHDFESNASADEKGTFESGVFS